MGVDGISGRRYGRLGRGMEGLLTGDNHEGAELVATHFGSVACLVSSRLVSGVESVDERSGSEGRALRRRCRGPSRSDRQTAEQKLAAQWMSALSPCASPHRLANQSSPSSSSPGPDAPASPHHLNPHTANPLHRFPKSDLTHLKPNCSRLPQAKGVRRRVCAVTAETSPIGQECKAPKSCRNRNPGRETR